MIKTNLLGNKEMFQRERERERGGLRKVENFVVNITGY